MFGSSTAERAAVNRLVVGSNPTRTAIYGLLAQLVEQLTFNQLVASSSLAQPTISAESFFLTFRAGAPPQ